MKHNETLPGEFYTVIHNSHVGKYKWITRRPGDGYTKCPYLEILNDKYGAYTRGSTDAFSVSVYTFEPATWEERQWLQDCIAAGCRVAKREFDNYQIY